MQEDHSQCADPRKGPEMGVGAVLRMSCVARQKAWVHKQQMGAVGSDRHAFGGVSAGQPIPRALSCHLKLHQKEESTFLLAF